jgi:ribosomal protein S18 acetylase RimI-like enzyme
MRDRRLWVAPAARGTGAGDQLVAAVLDWAAARGAHAIYLHVTHGNARAQAFYLRNGFRLTGERLVRQRDGTIELEMCRLVDAGD